MNISRGDGAVCNVVDHRSLSIHANRRREVEPVTLMLFAIFCHLAQLLRSRLEESFFQQRKHDYIHVLLASI
jgi:hypothetical protein